MACGDFWINDYSGGVAYLSARNNANESVQLNFRVQNAGNIQGAGIIYPTGNWYLGNSSNISNYKLFVDGNTFINDTMGIMMKPSFPLDVNGYIRCTTLIQASDAQLKTNIQNIDSSLSTVLKLQGVTYNLKQQVTGSVALVTDSLGHKINALSTPSTDTRKRLGFIAQSVQQVLPQLVYADKNGLLNMDYISIIPLLVEAVKALKYKNDTLTNELSLLNQNLQSCCSLNNQTKSLDVSNGTTNLTIPDNQPAALYQNIPNPFNINTQINCYIPGSVANAALYIYNLQGLQLKSISISERENTSVIINGSELSAGIYLYSLITDNTVVDTKQMILTK